MARRGRSVGEGGGAAETRALRLSQRLAPVSRRALPWMPERPTRFAMGETYARWPGLWGLTRSGNRVRTSREAFERAFPDEDADRFLSEWVRAKGRGMAACVGYLARWDRGRRSRVIRPVPGFELPDGPCVFAFLHYSIDPLAQLACMSGAPGRSVRCVNFPMQPGLEDDRELWLVGAETPPHITEMLLSVTDPRWVARGVEHLRGGGTVYMAMDSPFDANRRAPTTIPVGRSRLPLAPSLELFAATEGVRLVLAWPYPRNRGSWLLDVRPAASAGELARLAGEWIEAHREHWAGWPYLVWRQPATAMREHASRPRAEAGGG